MAHGIIEYLERQPYDRNNRTIPMVALHDKLRDMLEIAKQGNFNEADEMAEAFCFSLGWHLWFGVFAAGVERRFEETISAITGGGAIKPEPTLPHPGPGVVIPFRARH